MFHDVDTITDQPERQIVAELIREKALRALNERRSRMVSQSPSSGCGTRKGQMIVDIDATIICRA